MTQYNHLEIEKKWQNFWAKNKTFKAKTNSDKPKFYALDMFPYPSGAGLHVGHPLGYTATDIISRKKKMQGYNVLHPMGWDAFGLPAENFAIKTGVHPEKSTNENIKNFTRQIKSLGFSYDWDREINTTDPSYYKWSQWLFLKFYKKGLLYESSKPMNWCPSCKVVCANEEVEKGLHERCGNKVERKNLKQWMFRITQYADRLLKDLDKPNVVFLHGWGGKGDSGWFSSIQAYLKQNKIEYLAPNFPNTDNPVYTEWKAHFKKEVLPKINEKTIILGHSLGGGFIQRYLTEEDLKIAELVLVAPTVGDCGIDEIKNFFITKKRGCNPQMGGHSNGDSATPSLFGSILQDDILQVKKKKTKKHRRLTVLKKVIKLKDKEIIFDGELLASHFLSKSFIEFKFRQAWSITVINALPQIKFNDENVGYFLCRNNIFKVVLSKVSNERFIVKTFYKSQNLTKFYQKNIKNLKSPKFEFNYSKIKNSADNIFIYAGGDDHYIQTEEFEFLAKKLSAHFDYDPSRGHMGQSEFERNEVVMPYFEKLVAGILDWPEKIRAMQRNWIGKSTGAEVDFELEDGSETITVFTTRPDTLFGATYFVLSPEHPLVEKLTTEAQKEDIRKYTKECAGKSDMERTELNKDKSGVFTGGYVINPVNNAKIPVWIADYVLMSYGTGAIMAVPAHDERDLEFAEKYNLPIIEVVGDLEDKFSKTGGALKNSDFLNGLSVEKAISKILEWLEEKKLGKKQINYRLRDWIFTRQRYWGEPIPLIHCEDCGIVPHDPEFAKYTKKEEYLSLQSKGGCSYVTTANSSLSNTIISSLTNTVKRKFGEEVIKTQIGEIKFNVTQLRKHFVKKSRSERNFRFNNLKLISEILKKGLFIENKTVFLVYGRFKNKIFRVVVSKNAENKFYVKTFYQAHKLTKIWKELKAKYSLPLTLPKTAKYEPSESGESPLAKITDWVNCECPKCGGKAKRETSTMPNWAGSSWYWLRFMDTNNEQKFCSKSSENYWGPVDLYVGGAEHAVLHLLYARFWHKALYDMGLVSTKEPFKKLVNQGMIISFAYENESGGLIPVDEVEEKNGKFIHTKTGKTVKRITAKMSKSLKNVINPDKIVEKYGADTLRMYEMFMGQFEQSKVWDMGAVSGIRKFLDKVYRYFMENEVVEECPTKELISLTHQTVKTVENHIDDFKFNTAISQLMVWINSFVKLDSIPKISGGRFIRLLAPFAPHLAEEIWTTKFKPNSRTIAFEHWPTYKEELLVSDLVKYAVQVNGKLRGDFEIDKNKSKENAINKAKQLQNISKWLENKDIIKEIFVKDKIIGFVVK